MEKKVLTSVKQIQSLEDLEMFAHGAGWESWADMDEDVGFTSAGVTPIGSFAYSFYFTPEEEWGTDGEKEPEPVSPITLVKIGRLLEFHYNIGAGFYRIYTYNIEIYQDADGNLFMDEVD